jgi:hypothetical protein
MPSKNDQPRFKWRMLKIHTRTLKQAKQLAEATYLLGE